MMIAMRTQMNLKKQSEAVLKVSRVSYPLKNITATFPSVTFLLKHLFGQFSFNLLSALQPQKSITKILTFNILRRLSHRLVLNKI